MNVDKFGRYSYTGMTIDKFGRHASRERLRGPRGEGFKLTDEGHYDMESKRLVNVSDPATDTDGVNLKTVQAHTSLCMRLNVDSYDAKNKRICNVAEPVSSNEVATKSYCDKRAPYKSDPDRTYSFHQYRIQDVAAPEIDGDAINLLYLKNHALTKNRDNSFDAGNTLIQNTAPPLNAGDVVNKGYFDSNTVMLNDGNWDSKNKRLTHVAQPQHDDDAVTRRYFASHTPSRTKHGWTFQNKRLQFIGSPVEITDAVSLGYVKMATLHKSGGIYDAQGFRIINIPKPQELDDVVSKRYVKTVLGDLGYALYKSINKGRASLIPADEWKNKVMDSTWEELFK